MSDKIKFASVKEQMDVIRRGISELIPEDELMKKVLAEAKEHCLQLSVLGSYPKNDTLL